jgi:hypothetical protein
MNVIERDGVVLARHIKATDIQENLTFFSQDEEFIQVGAWNYDAGKELFAHIHNEVPRMITRTSEVLYVVAGRIEATIFTLDENPVKTLVLNVGEILVLLECGHGYKILDDGTKVFEIKNGPYLGAETDRRRI